MERLELTMDRRYQEMQLESRERAEGGGAAPLTPRKGRQSVAPSRSQQLKTRSTTRQDHVKGTPAGPRPATRSYQNSLQQLPMSPGMTPTKNLPQGQGIKYVLIPEGLRDFQWLRGLLGKTPVSEGPYKNRRPWMDYSGQFDENRFYVLHPDFLRYALKGLGWAIFRPTNGAFTLFLALHTCDVVDAYGFITEDHGKYPNYYVERYSKTKVIFYANHDYSQEIKSWKKLHDTKIIRLYQRQEDPEGTTGKPKQP
ncbi:unnamed protein product [Coregonus sp. 'balchen']|nr:unnamed protein product [Coregonus sp. 'balchen']